MDKNSKILVVGHNDIIEQSLYNGLLEKGYIDVTSWSKKGLNILDPYVVNTFFEAHQFEYVFLGSTRSGGIGVNQKHPGEFIYHNLQSSINIIHTAAHNNVKKLLYLTGSCAYPKQADQPIKEESLLTGPLELTSEAYSVAKIAGTKMCEAYRQEYGFNAITAVPATLYGPLASFNPETAHVLGALMGKFHEANAQGLDAVDVWGTGEARREFIYASDFVDAVEFLMKEYNSAGLVNIGSGEDISIKELAFTIKDVVGFKGEVAFDTTKPDGTMKKLMDVSKINQLGWQSKVSLQEGIKKMYEWYLNTK